MPGVQWIAAALLGGYGALQGLDVMPWTITSMSLGEIVATGIGLTLTYAGLRPLANPTATRNAYRLLRLINQRIEPWVGTLPTATLPLLVAGGLLIAVGLS